MLEVTGIDGQKYWVSSHAVVGMSAGSETELLLLSGHRLSVLDDPETLLERLDRAKAEDPPDHLAALRPAS